MKAQSTQKTNTDSLTISVPIFPQVAGAVQPKHATLSSGGIGSGVCLTLIALYKFFERKDKERAEDRGVEMKRGIRVTWKREEEKEERSEDTYSTHMYSGTYPEYCRLHRCQQNQ